MKQKLKSKTTLDMKHKEYFSIYLQPPLFDHCFVPDPYASKLNKGIINIK